MRKISSYFTTGAFSIRLLGRFNLIKSEHFINAILPLAMILLDPQERTSLNGHKSVLINSSLSSMMGKNVILVHKLLQNERITYEGPLHVRSIVKLNT